MRRPPRRLALKLAYAALPFIWHPHLRIADRAGRLYSLGWSDVLRKRKRQLQERGVQSRRERRGCSGSDCCTTMRQALDYTSKQAFSGSPCIGSLWPRPRPSIMIGRFESFNAADGLPTGRTSDAPSRALRLAHRSVPRPSHVRQSRRVAPATRQHRARQQTSRLVTRERRFPDRCCVEQER